jgi:hypothetical protein
MKCAAFLLAGIMVTGLVFAGPVINEAVTESDGDWVELVLMGDDNECMDISALYVTMYYGTNEQLALEPVTLCVSDRSETPYDDRFVVVHLTRPGVRDETDLTGDTNGNGHLDVYCNNYYASLWNSDGVVAIDSDDDPSNGGVIDFLAYSNRDGTPNSTIDGYVARACSQGQWGPCGGSSMQDNAVFIGDRGLSAGMSIARKQGPDTNRADDFAITPYATPGKPNILSVKKGGRSLLRVLKKRIAVSTGSNGLKDCALPVFVYRACTLRFRIFSVTGICLYRSGLFKDLHAGTHSIDLGRALRRSIPVAGLYICQIEASARSQGLSESQTVYLVLGPQR